MLSLFVLAVALLAQGVPSQRTITVNTITGRDVLTFDPARTSEDNLRRWIRLSPNNVDFRYTVPESLELCVKSDPAYLDCGTRDWRAKNFAFNANVNLQRIRARIKTLDDPSYPPELKEVASHLKRIQEANLFFQSRLLAFIQDGQTSTFSASFDGIDPKIQCSAAVAKVLSAADKDQANRIASGEWWNCVNHAYRDKIGPYPVSAWSSFLNQHGIREQFIDDPTD
jgi:hypothetical protein